MCGSSSHIYNAPAQSEIILTLSSLCTIVYKEIKTGWLIWTEIKQPIE